MNVTLPGGIISDIPKDFPSFFRKGTAINPKYGKPFEHQIYGVYLALQALELRQDTDYSKLKTKIVNAVLARRKDCNGFWLHNQPPGPGVIHFRSTSSAIRLLVEAYVDGLIHDENLIGISLRKHLSFSERLDNGGLWFYHDSLESFLSNSPDPRRMFKNTAWGSSTQNALVLNTHIDTLVTILHVLKWVNLPDDDRQVFAEFLEAGLNTLQYILTPLSGLMQASFQVFDSFARKQIFKCYKDCCFLGYRAWCKAFFLYYSRLRPYLKVKFPFFIYNDGFLERDLGRFGLSYIYHLVNTRDLAKLALQLDAHSLYAELSKSLRQIVIKGLQYTFSPSYFRYIEYSFTKRNDPILACEALFTLFRREQLLSDIWIQRYISIRRRLPPTPALLGYDPVILDHSLVNNSKILCEFEIDPQSADILILSARRYLIINISDTDCALPCHITKQYSPVWTNRYSDGLEKVTIVPPYSAILLERNS